MRCRQSRPAFSSARSETNATPCRGAGIPAGDWAATYPWLECDGRSVFTLQVPEFGSVPAFDIVGCGAPQPSLSSAPRSRFEFQPKHHAFIPDNRVLEGNA